MVIQIHITYTMNEALVPDSSGSKLTKCYSTVYLYVNRNDFAFTPRENRVFAFVRKMTVCG